MLTALRADNQELFSLIDCWFDELTQIRSEQAFVRP
ncbi:competence protein CoiA, partial [Enterococcus faecalis]